MNSKISGHDFLGKVLHLVLVLLICTCVFDPADKLLGLKVPLFILVWLIFIAKHLCGKGMLSVPFSMVLYFMLFSCVLPLLSMFNFVLSTQTFVDYDGFGYLKAYLFLSLIFVLFIEDIDLTGNLSIALALLSIAIIAVLIMIKYEIFDPVPLWAFAQEYGMFGTGFRSYGGYDYVTVDFYASPMFVISVAYFTYLFLTKEGLAKMGIGIVLLFNMVAMFVVGNRGSILLSVIVPFATWFAYSKKKPLVIGILSIFMIVVVSLFKGAFIDALSSQESSNALKLSFFGDYAVVFDSLKNLLIGQGLGAKFFVSGRGGYFSIVELTYIELIRNYGLLFSVFYFVLLAIPFIMYKAYRHQWYLLIAYASYLLMSAGNPLIFSSTGMLVLSIVLCKAFKFVPLENKIPNSKQLLVRC